MGYESNYKNAINKAKKENKPIMLVIEEKYCPWCEKLAQETLSHPKLAKLIKENFVGIQLIQDSDDIPHQFYADVFPTVYFINPYNEDYYFKSRGYKGAVKFKKRLLHAIRSHKDR
jgi:ssDNA-specific exonuclease RecJ